jgi:hypothetical protein
MGDHCHFAIIVVADNHEGLMTLREKAEALLPGLVSPIVPGRGNLVESFYIAPDGSQIGRGPQERAAREEYLKWLRTIRDERLWKSTGSDWIVFDWTCVAFGFNEPYFWTPEDPSTE